MGQRQHIFVGLFQLTFNFIKTDIEGSLAFLTTARCHICGDAPLQEERINAGLFCAIVV